MRRRDFIKLIAGSAVTLPGAVHAQAPERMRRVIVLLGLDERDPEAQGRIKEFRLGMRDLGWINGRNVQIETRFAGSNPDLIKNHVTEAIKLTPDVIVANSIPVMAALHPLTHTIPIVFAALSNPVGQGYISNLARPGRNITGFSFIEPEIIGKWINLLSDVNPSLSRVILMFNPDTALNYDVYLQAFKATPQQPSVEVNTAHVRSIAETGSVIAKAGRETGSGLIAPGDTIIRHRADLMLPTRSVFCG